VKSIKKAFQAASERSGIHVTPYTLRHTGAVWAAEAGVSMDELAQFLGHDDAPRHRSITLASARAI
jgi:integrase